MFDENGYPVVSTHMPLTRHDVVFTAAYISREVSTHMPLTRHDKKGIINGCYQLMFLLTCLLRGMTFSDFDFERNVVVSTHMPLARHDLLYSESLNTRRCFYSHASCEA